MLRTTKKEMKFYTDFLNVITLAHEAAVHLNGLMKDYTDVEAKLRKMTDYEHRCDAMIHDLFAEVHAAFITPIDREDITLIAKSLDDIMDELDESAHLFYVYNTKEIKPQAVKVSELIVEATAALAEIIRLMPNPDAKDLSDPGIDPAAPADGKKKKRKPNQMMRHNIEVNRLENQGDQIYREELARLFRDEPDPVQVIRWSGIYSRLEKALDACEYVANIIEGVMLKHG